MPDSVTIIVRQGDLQLSRVFLIEDLDTRIVPQDFNDAVEEIRNLLKSAACAKTPVEQSVPKVVFEMDYREPMILLTGKSCPECGRKLRAANDPDYLLCDACSRKFKSNPKPWEIAPHVTHGTHR